MIGPQERPRRQHSPGVVQSASDVHVAPPPLLAALLTELTALELEATDVVAALELPVVLLVVLDVVVVMPPAPPAPVLDVVPVPVPLPPVPPVPDVVVGFVLPPQLPNSVEPSAQAASTRPLVNNKARTRRRRLERMARYKYRITVGPWKRLCAIRSYDPGAWGTVT